MKRNSERSRGAAADDAARGAAAVEFALILPLLLTLLLGIIEFGWLYTQQLDIRHGAREAARLVSVNDFPAGEDATSMTASEQSDHLVATICARMDFAGQAEVSINLADALAEDAGATAVVVVEADLETITGWFDPILANKRLVSSIEVRLEQNATWEAVTATPCPA